MKIQPKCITTIEGKIFNLSTNKIYEVIGIESDDYRLLSDINDKCDGNKPYLYEKEYFKIIENTEPEFWETKFGEDGERYSYPIEFNTIGFFEDFHNGDEEFIIKFWKIIKDKYPEIWKERNIYVPNKYKQIKENES